MTRLPPFSTKTRCAKCGCEDASVEFRAAGDPSPLNPESPADVDRLDRRCRLCGYQWAEACSAVPDGL